MASSMATLTIDINAKLAGIQNDLGKVAHMAEINAKRIEGAFSGVGSAIKNALAGIGTWQAAKLFTNFVQQAIDAQDALVDLSKSTAISVETLAGLKLAATTTGGDIESLASAINKLQVNIGKNPEKFKQLGIDAKDGYEAFKQLADIFVSIEDPETRAAVAAEAIGKAWAGNAAALSEGAKGFEALVQKGKEVSGVTAESAARAAELNAKLDILKARAGGAATELVNSLVPSLDRTAARMEALAAQGNGLQAVFVGLIGLAKLPFDLALGEVDLSRAGQIKDLENKLQSLETKAKQATGQGGIIGELIYGKKGEFDKQIAVTRNQLEALKKFGSDKAGTANAVEDAAKKGPSKEQTNRFLGVSTGGGARGGSRAGKAIDDGARLVEQLRDQIRATQDLTEVEKLEIAIADGKYKTATAGNLSIARSYAETLDNIKANKDAIEEEIEAIKKKNEVSAEGTRVMESVRTPTEALNAELGRLLMLLEKEAINMETFGRAASKAGEEMQRLDAKAEETGDQLGEFAKSAAQNMQSAFADFLFDPFSDGADSMAKKFGDSIKRMIAEAASADLMKRLFGDFGGKGGGGSLGGWVGKGLDFLGGLFKSANGNVFNSPGLSAYSGSVVSRPTIFPFASGAGLMGEAGPEAILPLARNGSGKLGVRGGQNISVVINMSGGSNASDLRQAAGDIARRIGHTVAGAARYA